MGAGEHPGDESEDGADAGIRNELGRGRVNIMRTRYEEEPLAANG